jgi:pimeloyl-ACP methyl ester carboxylesterase
MTMSRRVALAVALVVVWVGPLLAQREVAFPPAESKPPPPLKSPPKMQASGEDTGIIPDAGPTMRKTQDRTPPPPTNLTVMYKVEYGEKLSYKHPDGTVQVFEQWKSYPNDGYNLVTNLNQRLNDGNNYQYATKALTSDGFDPVDIPLLYMAGDYDFVFTPSEVEHLRKFLIDGGTIIFNAARGRDEFSRAVVREMRKVLPSKPMMRLSLDHPAFNARYRIAQVTVMINGVQTALPPEIYSCDIGTRAAAILVPNGLGAALSATPYHPEGKHLVGESAKRLAVNLMAYVLGSTEYGRFLAQEFPLYQGQTRPGDVFRFAQVKYSGSWDVNPALVNSVCEGLKLNTGIDADFAPRALAFDDADLGQFPTLFMTGHYDFKLTPAEADGLTKYLKRGGLLVASSAAGLKPFDQAFRREFKKAVPDGDLIKLPPTHPLFTAGFNAVDRVKYTASALKDDPNLETPEFYAYFHDGRLAVLYCPFDVMSAVNRESNAYAKGIAGDDAMKVLVNIITYALSQ